MRDHEWHRVHINLDDLLAVVRRRNQEQKSRALRASGQQAVNPGCGR